MEWLKYDIEEKVLKEKYGTLKNLIKSIKRDSKELFLNYNSKDKNIVDMFKITSNSWKGITEKIIIFKDVIKKLNIDINKIESNNEQENINNQEFFLNQKKQE